MSNTTLILADLSYWKTRCHAQEDALDACYTVHGTGWYKPNVCLVGLGFDWEGPGDVEVLIKKALEARDEK